MLKTKTTVRIPTGGYGTLVFNAFKHSALPVFRKESEDLANSIVKDLKNRLRRQLFNHTPLSAKYRKRKIKFGYDARILMASKQYYNSITVIKTEYGARVGVKDVMHYPNKMEDDWQTNQKKSRKRGGKSPGAIPMADLAHMLEFGTTNAKSGHGGPAAGQPWHMPPRPHWRPVMNKFRREHNIIKRNFTNKINEALEKALEKEVENLPFSELR